MRNTSMGGAMGMNPAMAAAMSPPAEDDSYGPPSTLEQFLPHAILAATGVGAGAVDEFVMPKVHRAWGRFSNKYFPIKKASYGGSEDMRNEMFIRGLVDGLAKLGFVVGTKLGATNVAGEVAPQYGAENVHKTVMPGGAGAPGGFMNVKKMKAPGFQARQRTGNLVGGGAFPKATV